MVSNQPVYFGKYSFLVPGVFESKKYRFQRLKKVLEYNAKVKPQVIVVDVLDPELFLLFSQIKLIVTSQGSPLSHMSILAREYQIPVIRCDFSVEIPNNGFLIVNQDDMMIDFLEMKEK